MAKLELEPGGLPLVVPELSKGIKKSGLDGGMGDFPPKPYPQGGE